MLVVWYSFVLLLFLHQPGDITASVRWPRRRYALLKPKTGCPEEWEEKNWEQNCWINQGTVGYKPNQNSKGLHIEGNVYNSSVKRYFCIQNIAYHRTGTTWPKGQYCIYSRYQPQEMHWGSIKMHNEKYNYHISAAISCKDHFVGVYVHKEWNESYIDLYFACQTSGDKKIPISLPITKPFYLLPYGSRDCQQVKWMVATTEWIKYDTRNYINRRYQKGFHVPYLELGNSSSNRGITMFYCYYESCNYTLTNTKGIFQSPGFPGKYPDRQLCSWRIMVPVNHTLIVNFKNFSLYDYDEDCLQLYENNSKFFKRKQAFFGHQAPFTITATRDVMFVFRSDEENNSTGFRANYTMFTTPERTTTAPPKTTAQSTTTVKPTTEHITTQPTITKQPTTKQPTTTEATATFPTTTNVNSTANETVQCNPTTTKNNIHPLKKTWFCDETWRIVVMVIPLVVFILIVLVIFNIYCRCRSKKASKSGTSGSSVDDGMVVNPTYEQGNIIIDQTTGATTDVSTVNTVDEQPQSRDEPPDYEDVDYTQLNEVPPPRRSTKRQECHALEPIGYDTPDVFHHVLEPPNIESSDGPQCHATNHSGKDASSIFYHVLEPPEIESDGPQFHAPEPVGNGAPEVFYHTLESPTALNRPTYQNLSEVNHYTLNPLYESAENSDPLVEANKLYDNSIA